VDLDEIKTLIVPIHQLITSQVGSAPSHKIGG